MKIGLFKKIKHFVLKVLKVIGIALIYIFIVDLDSLIINGGHLYEVYKIGPLFLSDLHDEGFYTFSILIIVSVSVCYFIEWFSAREGNDHNKEENEANKK